MEQEAKNDDDAADELHMMKIDAKKIFGPYKQAVDYMNGASSSIDAIYKKQRQMFEYIVSKAGTHVKTLGSAVDEKVTQLKGEKAVIDKETSSCPILYKEVGSSKVRGWKSIKDSEIKKIEDLQATVKNNLNDVRSKFHSAASNIGGDSAPSCSNYSGSIISDKDAEGLADEMNILKKKIDMAYQTRISTLIEEDFDFLV